MIYFLDASALVKAYVREAGTDEVRKLLRRTLAVSAISLVEVTSALRRRAREGTLTQPHADVAAAAVKADIRAMWMVEARRSVLEDAADLVGRHPLRNNRSGTDHPKQGGTECERLDIFEGVRASLPPMESHVDACASSETCPTMNSLC